MWKKRVEEGLSEHGGREHIKFTEATVARRSREITTPRSVLHGAALSPAMCLLSICSGRTSQKWQNDVFLFTELHL